MGVCIWTTCEGGRGRTAQRPLSPQFARSLQGLTLSLTSQEQKVSPDSSPTPGPLTFFLTQVIHGHCRNMPHHSLLDTSSSPLLSGTVARGQRLQPPAAMRWEPGPATTLLGPAPSSVPSTARSGPFKLLLTVAYTDGLGLDTSPARKCVETG